VSDEEYDICDGWLAATIFQNISDPSGHGLNELISATGMYQTLIYLVEQKSEISKVLKKRNYVIRSSWRAVIWKSTSRL
jgi:hypothetical protein